MQISLVCAKAKFYLELLNGGHTTASCKIWCFTVSQLIMSAEGASSYYSDRHAQVCVITITTCGINWSDLNWKSHGYNSYSTKALVSLSEFHVVNNHSTRFKDRFGSALLVLVLLLSELWKALQVITIILHVSKRNYHHENKVMKINDTYMSY